MELLLSQLMVVVAPTAAVAVVPKEPTMAVSIYWPAVCITCSTIVGQARATIIAKVPKDSFFLISFHIIYLLR